MGGAQNKEPQLGGEPPPEPELLQVMSPPGDIALSMGGATVTMRNAMSAPPSAAVAQTFALARVSAPIIWPRA